MSRPSEPLLRWLRKQIDARGENTSGLALKLGRPKAELRKLLTGAEPLTVDDLIRLTEALGLSEDQMGVPPALREAVGQVEDTNTPEDEHWENQPRALFKFGFDRGIDFMFLAAADEVGEWGGPARVIDQYRGREIPLQLDAAWHKHMKPELDEDGLTLTLSFDGLYRCTFPWSAVRRVIFMPLPPSSSEAPKAPPDPEPTAPTDAPKGRGGHLRLVR